MIAERNFKTWWFPEFSWLTYDNIKQTMYCNFCLKAGKDVAGQSGFLTGNNHFTKAIVKKNMVTIKGIKMLAISLVQSALPMKLHQPVQCLSHSIKMLS